MKFLTRTLAAAAAATLAIGLASARTTAPVTTVSFGVVPLEAPAAMFKKFAPLAKYLEQETGVKVRLAIGKDYDAAMDAIGRGQTHLAFLTPTTLPKAQRLYPEAEITPVARFLNEGAGTYRSCIVVAADSPITSLEQVAGTAIGFGSESSTSSHLMPRSMLKAAGVDPDTDGASVEYLGSHTNVIKAIEVGKVQVGGVKESVAEKAAKDGLVRIIATSVDIPEFPVAFSKNLPEDLRVKFTAAFAKLNDGSDTSKAVLTALSSKYTGTEVAKNEDYDAIRTMIATLYGEAFYATAK
jgi:phosphonate transport system substrate-binding protein